MYDPATARFLSKDPIEERGGSSNLYLYCANDPVNRTDPSGASPEPRIPTWFNKLSQKKDNKRIITREQWDKTFGGSVEADILWDWLFGSVPKFVTEDEIRRIVTNTDPERNTDAKVAVYTPEGAFRRGRPTLGNTSRDLGLEKN